MQMTTGNTLTENPLWRLISGSLLARAAGAIAGLGLQIGVARMLGLEASGEFYTAQTLMILLGIAAKCGIDTDLLRRAAPIWHSGNLEATATKLGSALSTGALTSFCTALFFFLFAPPLADAVLGTPTRADLLRIFAVALLPQTLIWILAALLRSMDRPAAAVMLEVGFVPLFTAAGFVVLAATGELSLYSAAIVHLTAIILSLGLALCLIGLPTRPILHGLKAPQLPRGAANLTGVELLNFLIASSALPLVTAMAGADQGGLFNASHRLTTQVHLLAVLIGGVLAPRIAASHAQQDFASLTALLRRGQLITTGLALPVLIPMLIYPQIFAALFGEAFSNMQTPLRILALGQLINALSGPAGYLLMMTGQERLVRNILLGSALVFIPLTALGAHLAGAAGAAGIAASAVAVQNLAFLFQARRYLHQQSSQTDERP